MSRKVVAEFDAIDGPFLNKLRAIDRSIGRFETGTLNAFGRVEKGMAGLLSSAAQLRNVTGLVAGSLGASMVTGFLDTSTKIRNALREIGGDSDEAFNQVYLAATRSLAPMDAFAQGVQRMQKVMGDKQTFTESVRQMETLSKLMALGGNSTQERASTMLQFSQALQSGYLGGEELRAIRENAPIELVRAIAREAGGGIEDLKKFGEQGVLTTEVMIRALKSLEQEADARIGKVRLTIEDAATVMRNGAIVATEGFDKGLGLSRAAVSTLQVLGQILGANAEAFEIFGKAAQIAGAAMAVGFARRRVANVGEIIKESGVRAKEELAAVQAQALAARSAANDANDARNKKAAALRQLSRDQDTFIQGVRNGALAEANSATVARGAAQDRVAQSKMAIAASRAELAQTEKLIAAEARRRSMGIMGASRRDLYGDATVVRKEPGMTEAAFQETVARRAAIEAKLKALDVQRIASEKAVTAAMAQEVGTRARLDMAGLQAATDFAKKNDRQRQILLRQLASAEDRVSAAQMLQTKTSTALAAAQVRLSLTTRALTFAGNALKSAFMFLGGWPGILLMAGMAFLTMSANAETAADRIEKMNAVTDTARDAGDSLADAQSRLKEAIEQVGTASDGTARKIAAATKVEVEAKRDLLAIENDLLKSAEAKRKIEMGRMEREIAAMKPEVAAPTSFGDAFSGVAGASPEDAAAEASARAMSEYEARVQAARLALAQMRNESVEAQKVLTVNAQILADAMNLAPLIGPAGMRVVEAQQAAVALSEEALAKYNQQLATLEQQASIQALINQYGADSYQVTAARAEAERAAYEAAAIADGIMGDYLAKLMSAYDAAHALSMEDVGAMVRAALGPAASLASQLWDAATAAAAVRSAQLEAAASVRRIPGGVDAVASGDVRLGGKSGSRRYVAPVIPGSGLGAGGGGGGGGVSQTDKAQEEALRFIEQMMTAEEKRAKNLKEMTELRAKLVASYGPEAAIVAQMDQAIQRASAELSNMDTVAKDFFSTLSDEIASSIEDWKGWGSFVRSVLASLVRSWGPDFFSALFMPGMQKGGGAGTVLGNMLTGQLHGGGGEGNRNARSVPAAAFINAPRFHNGLASDEFTAILQKGETVLPKGMKLGGGGTTINFSADLRGADPSMKPYIDAKFKQIEREFNGRVVGAIRVANKSRSLQ